MTLPSPTRIARALGVASVTASLILAAVIWFPVVSGDTEGPTFDQRDWIAFHRTGVRLAEGRSAEIYLGDMEDRSRPEFTDGLFFLYPPPVAWLTRPLGNLEPRDAYAICIAVVAAGALAVFLSLLAVTPARPAHRVLAFVALAASLPWNSAIVLGHLGTLLVVPLAGGLAALGAGRSGLSGAALGLLLVKPNWGVPLLALLVIGRQWRMVRGFLATAAFLVAVFGVYFV